MLQINLSVSSINYDSILHLVYPTVLEKVKASDSQNLLYRLITELGEDGEKVLLALMKYFPEDAKNELVCQCLNSYGEMLTRLLNKYLEMDSWGKNFTIGSCHVAKKGESLVLIAEQVSANYQALLVEFKDSQKVKQTVERFASVGF